MKNVCGDGQCAAFWERMATVSYMQGHPIIQEPSLWHSVIPLGFHGDGAAFTKLDKLMAFSWNPILCPGQQNRLDSRFMIAAIPTTWLLSSPQGPVTLWQLSNAIAWSFAVLLEGRYPRTDHKLRPWDVGSHRAAVAGQQIAGQFTGTIVDYRGDWQQQILFWRVPDFNGVDEMCWECDATLEGPRQFSDFSDAAFAQRQPTTTNVFLQRHPMARANPFTLLPGWRIQFIKWDETHLVKLGVARLVVASALVRLVERRLFGPPPLEDQLKRAWAAFREWACRNRIQHNVRKFTKARLGLNGAEYPESSTKAWNTRVLVAWLAEVSGNAHDAPATESNCILALLLHSLHEFFATMENCSSLFFSDAELTTFADSVRRFLAAYNALALEAFRDGKLRWPIRPKHHGMVHLRHGALTDSRNPKRFGCMLDEDFLGRVVRVANKCHRRTVATGVLLRYLIRLARHWRGSGRVPLRRRLRLHQLPRVMLRPLPPRL